MKIALINTIRPAEGTGDGMTEYTYQLYTRLQKSNEVDLIYSVDKLVRNNVKGLLYTNTLFKLFCEMIIEHYSELYGIDYAILRFANVTGGRSEHGIVHDFTLKL